MKGLVLKDLMNLKRYSLTVLALLILYAALSVVNGDSSYLCGLLAVLGAMLPITAFSYDEKAGWDKYALSMPVSRKALVLSKYVLGAVLSFVLSAVAVIAQLFLDQASIGQAVSVSAVLWASGLVLLSLIMPFFFWFGAEKGRYVMIMVIVIPLVLAFTLVQQITAFFMKIEAMHLSLVAIIATCILTVLAILCGSVLLATAIYEHKEF